MEPAIRSKLCDGMRACRPRSSLLSRIVFDEEHGVLVVTLPGERKYAYLAVPLALYRELCTADSPGQFYNERIKGHFACQRVKAPREGKFA